MDNKFKHVTYEQAVLLKEKNFNIMCFYYYENGILTEPYLENGSSTDVDFRVDLSDLLDLYGKWSSIISAPEINQVIDWLFEKYLIDISVIPFREKGSKSIGFQYRIINFSDNEIDEVMFEHQYNTRGEVFTSKQEAYSKAIDDALKLI